MNALLEYLTMKFGEVIVQIDGEYIYDACLSPIVAYCTMQRTKSEISYVDREWTADRYLLITKSQVFSSDLQYFKLTNAGNQLMSKYGSPHSPTETK